MREHFDVIRRSSAAGRDFLKQMSPRALINYTVLISSPQILTRLPGMGSRVPPTYNIIISNVPGPRGKLYFLGAEMEAYYPISALSGQALNITVLSFAGGLFWLHGLSDKVPHLQRLAVYTGDAIDELERVFLRARAGKVGKDGKVRKEQVKTDRTGRAGRRRRSGRCRRRRRRLSRILRYQRSDQGRRSSSNVQASRGCWCRNQYASAMCSGARMPSSLLSA